ncbi:MAG TPA: acyl-CoA dehydrogenase family protein [Acidimicrobiia bacterium]|nr:acyl-CoA dehydrogenase family protein [Acidimicrobiia bacterium]
MFSVLDPPLAVERLAQIANDTADLAEQQRRLAAGFITVLRESGMGSVGIPRSYRGSESSVASILDLIETVASADGSAGWVTMIYATSSVTAHYLSEPAREEIYGTGDPSNRLVAGVLAPRGKVAMVPGGYRLSGRWPFASGSVDADWIGLGAIDGEGESRNYLVPMTEVEIVDTWDVVGLRATASHDVAVNDVFVPQHRMFDLGSAPVTEEAPAQFPIYGLLAAGIASVALGIARRALDDFVELGEAKVPTGSKRRLADRGAVQEAVARGEAWWGSGRSFLHGTVAAAAYPATLTDRARLRAAATLAVESARHTIDLAYTLAGGSAIYAGSRLQRQLRDIHTATQHMMVAQPTWELAGRVLMGMETDTSQL